MSTLPHLTVGRRLGGVLALLLLLMGVMAGVSALQLHQIGAQTVLVADEAASSTGALYRAQRAIDEVRGLSALHLLARNASEQAALERQIQFRRQVIVRELAAWDRRVSDDTDRRHREAVKALLAVLWQTLDRLVVVSRLSTNDAAAAEQARQLLAGEAQQAFQALGEALEAWWSFDETRGQDRAQRDHATARQLTWLLSALSGGALLMGGLVVAWITRPGPRLVAPQGRVPPAGASGGAPVAATVPGTALAPAQQEAGRRLAEGSEALAAQADVLAVAAAVDAARAGDAGPGLASLARSVRSLAQLAACVAAGAAAWRAAAESAAGAQAPGSALSAPLAMPVRDDADPSR